MTTLTLPAAPIEAPAASPTISLPPGQLTLLIGDPGTGKSLLSLDLAARISTHRPLPPQLPPTPNHNPNRNRNRDPHPTQNSEPTTQHSELRTQHSSSPILLFSAEDSHPTIADRFDAAGGDLTRLILLPASVRLLAPAQPNPDSPHPRIHNLVTHLDVITRKLGRPALLILDPLPALLAAADTYHASTLRAHLAPLLEFALAHNFPILAITHLAKPTTQNKNPLHRIIGSLAYAALARAIYHLTPDPRDPETRLVIPLKHNLAPITHAFSFQIAPSQSSVLNPQSAPTGHESRTTDHEPRATSPAGHDSRITDHEPRATSPTGHESRTTDHEPRATSPTGHDSRITDHEPRATSPTLLWNPTPIPHTPGNPIAEESQAVAQSQLEFAQDFLTTTLAQGPIPSIDLLRKIRQLSIPQRTINRAKYHLRITSRYDHTQKQWLTALPQNRAGSPSQE